MAAEDLARDNRFVFGVYRRHMKAIGYLGTFDRIFGVPATTTQLEHHDRDLEGAG